MNDIASVGIDTGTAYGRPERAYKANLVEVSRGTPMGELMRRYWQPVFVAEELTSDRPHKIRILGENLIIFRDKSGRPGLVAENCAHRGTSLYYGRIEDDGIRCCYHGWKFGPQGHCLEQPCEIDGGRNRDRIRQPWYPLQERYGLLYAYMGPPEKKPVLPRWKHLEGLGPDEVIEVREGALGGKRVGQYDQNQADFNWLQAFENTTDAPHLPWLHYHHSGDQFTGLTLVEGAELPPYARVKDMVGRIVVERTERGVKQGSRTVLPDGKVRMAANESMVPNVANISNFIDLAYFVPVDDTHYVLFFIWRSKFKGERSDLAEYHEGKRWEDLTDEEHRRMPGDYEAQSSIGTTPAHNWEHLSQGDAALGMLRRRLEDAVRDVQEGRDPPGLAFDEKDALFETRGHRMMVFDAAA